MSLPQVWQNVKKEDLQNVREITKPDGRPRFENICFAHQFDTLDALEELVNLEVFDVRGCSILIRYRFTSMTPRE